jgi:hypothetical protein
VEQAETGLIMLERKALHVYQIGTVHGSDEAGTNSAATLIKAGTAAARSDRDKDDPNVVTRSLSSNASRTFHGKAIVHRSYR